MIEKDGRISKDFYWFNEPRFEVEENRLKIQSYPDTDFWQKTHYGFQRDNGHCLLTDVQGDFSMTVRTEFHPGMQYDQSGLIVRLNSDNWIKASVEYETANHSRLGSVVTNNGYSDWATIDVYKSIQTMWYRIQSRGNDFLIEYSYDGEQWKQLRITHLQSSFDKIALGVYSCSPMDSSFEALFDNFELSESKW